MNTKDPLVSFRPFDVHIPNLEGDGVAETVRIDVPVRVDSATGEEVLTPEALALIEKTKLRRMGLMSPEEIQNLRQRFGLTQDEMSNLLQIGAKTYTRWESGRARPSRSMNVTLCALRDGQLDVNYLRALRDPGFSAAWFAQNRTRAMFISCFGAIKPTGETAFAHALAESSRHWFARHLEGWPSSSTDVIVHVMDAPGQSAWLFSEMKTDEKIEIKATMPRTISPRPPEARHSWLGFRRSMTDYRQPEEAISS
jgi:DNA-binding transcriptional regulator YiaG